jgi:hypothetical protein
MKPPRIIARWLRRKKNKAIDKARLDPARAYFSVLFDPDGRLMVCEDGVWKVFELDHLGKVRASLPGRLARGA